jgi:hypothetical protein
VATTNIILDKSQVKKLQDDNEVAYRDIWNLLQRGKEHETGIDEIILRISDNIKSIYLSHNQTDFSPTCSLIQRALSLKSMGHLSSRVYRLLPKEMKQIAYDHSSSKTLAVDSDKYPQQFEHYEKEVIEKIKAIRNIDWESMRRQGIQELQAELADTDIFIRNICTDKGITLMETNHDPLTRSTKKEVQHLRYLPRKVSKLREVLVREINGLAGDYTKLASIIDEKFCPSEEQLPGMIKATKRMRDFLDPMLDSKHHLDWLGWYKVWKLLKEYNINKVADLTAITDDNDLPRGMTREAIQNWLQKRGPNFFEEFIKQIPMFFELGEWYKSTMKIKYGLTNRMWGHASNKVKK